MFKAALLIVIYTSINKGGVTTHEIIDMATCQKVAIQIEKIHFSSLKAHCVEIFDENTLNERASAIKAIEDAQNKIKQIKNNN